MNCKHFISRIWAFFASLLLLVVMTTESLATIYKPGDSFAMNHTDDLTMVAVYETVELTCEAGKQLSDDGTECVKCKAGYVCAGGSELPKLCPAGSYCEAGSSEPTACPDGYTSTEGARYSSFCFISCQPGTAVFKIGETCTTPDGPWFTNATEKVYHGSISTINYCMDGAYIYNNIHEVSACAYDVPAGYQYVDRGEGLPVKYIRITNRATADNPTNFLLIEPFIAYETGTLTNVALASMGARMETVMPDGSIDRTISHLLEDGDTTRPIYPGKYTTIILDSEYDIYTLEFNHIPLNSLAAIPISIEVSTDGTNWTMVFNQESNPGSDSGYKRIPLTGKPEPCSAGTYSLGRTLYPIRYNEYLCQPVAGGYYSTGGGTSATGTCLDGYECGTVSLGLYSTCGATSAGNGDLAAKDYIECVDGCECGRVAAGYYSTGGGTSATGTCLSEYECGTMTAGYYSRGGAGKPDADRYFCWGFDKYSDGVNGCGLVAAGYYSTGGATSKTPNANGDGCVGEESVCGKVDAGYYSTGGGTSKTPTKNGAGCVGGYNTCGLIEAGYFGNMGAASVRGDGLCASGHYCPAGSTSDKQELCPAGYPYSDVGAAVDSDCYLKCEPYDVEYGTAIPMSDKEYYPSQCKFYGISKTGNPCDIVDGTCIETSCNYNFELVEGVCEPCARDNALSYKQGAGNCIVESCVSGYHPNGQSCEINVVECSVPNAISAERVWDASKQAFGECVITECDEGYHLGANICQLDEQVCELEHGIGRREWNHKTNAWGECVATKCDPGYTNDSGQTNELWKQCGRCNNMYSAGGELAASSYVEGCEIAACMYEGELYTLENNECVLICDTYSDETGSRKWNASRKKCERTCSQGYMSW